MLGTKAIEALQYMLMEIEKDEAAVERERSRIWIDYLSRIYSNPPQQKESAQLKRGRREFEDSFKPKDGKRKQPDRKEIGDSEEKQSKVWDLDKLRKIKEQQSHKSRK